MTAKPVERRREPRNDEEAAVFKSLGWTITAIRERRGMDGPRRCCRASWKLLAPFVKYEVVAMTPTLASVVATVP
jgi:hypothetical protein